MAKQDRREFIPMKAGPTYEATSDDSSSLYRKTTGLNTQDWADKRRTEESYKLDFRAGMSSSSVKGLMGIPTGQMTKEERRDLRKMLKVELNKVQGLSSKLKARELQLRGQSQSAEMYPSLSDAEFSRNDARSGGGKEITSTDSLHDAGLRKQQSITKTHSIPTEYSGTEGATEWPWLPRASPRHSPHVSKQQSYTENGGTLTDAELSHSKCTPSTQHPMYNSAGSDKMLPPVNSNFKHPGSSTKRVASSADERYIESNLLGVPCKKHSEFMSQCSGVLKKLMGHRDGWVFNEPVDAVALGLSDYHRVVEKPMDLGTIKSKLDKKQYYSAKQFASDVRLTFHNAMMYNPQGHDVHKMADRLLSLFEENWRPVREKLECGADEGESEVLSQAPGSPAAIQGFLSQPKSSKNMVLDNNGKVTKSKAIVKPQAPSKPKPIARPAGSSEPKRNMSYQEKANLVGSLQLLPAQMQDDVIRLMKERNPALDQKVDEMEVDIDSFDNETLWELDQYVKDCLSTANTNKKVAVQKSQPMGSSGAQNASKKRKGEHQEDDPDIQDAVPKSSSPAILARRHTGVGNRSWGSSRESGSSSDSDSESSA